MHQTGCVSKVDDMHSYSLSHKFDNLSCPEMDSTKTFIGEQWKFHNAHASSRLIGV